MSAPHTRLNEHHDAVTTVVFHGTPSITIGQEGSVADG